MKALPDDAPRSWATYGAADCVTEMVVAHALDRTTALQERPFAAWRTVVPQGASVSEAAPGSDVIVGVLRAGGLLRADELGVTLSPKWVAEALVHGQIAQLVRDRA
ncbi:MAG: hypothetical protein L6Q76_25795, partial [Polyangiaceae bacterium]|nr:hypothetical protein [Polyangiaceae bacterium]